MKLKPLFIWAGGKTKLIKKYKPFLPQTFDKYIEPFFGGGAMFCWAKNQCPRAKFVINDNNTSIMQIYKSVQSDVEVFINEMNIMENKYIPMSKEDRKKFFFELRYEHAYNYQNWSQTKEAAVLYFLFKTAFNGIYQINLNTNNRFGTPSGLLNQKDKVYNKENVKNWSMALKDVIILSNDFENVVRTYADNNTFAFMDPPYRGSFTQYGKLFDDGEQTRVLNLVKYCKTIGCKTFLSNRDCDDSFFENQLDNLQINYFDITYTAGRRKKTETGFEAKKAREILIRNF